MKYRNIFIVFLAVLAVVLTPAGVLAQTSDPASTAEVAQPPSQPSLEPTETKQAPPDQEEEDRQELADPREVKDVLRQIKDIRREVQRTLKKAKKLNLTSEADQLNGILSQVAGFETPLKGPSGTVPREALQDFWDAQVWDTINNIRIMVEMPNEIKSIERELKKLEKMVSRKNFAVEGVDMGGVNAKIAEVRAAVDQAKASLAGGNLEDAQESLQVVHEEGSHPGEIMGVMKGLSEITKQFKRIKSEEIRNDIKEILAPVYEAVDAGDFREARLSFQEIDRDLRSIINSVRSKSDIDSRMRDRIDKLQEKLQQKFNEGENEKKGGKEDMGALNAKNRQAYYDYRNYTASILTKFLDFIGW